MDIREILSFLGAIVILILGSYVLYTSIQQERANKRQHEADKAASKLARQRENDKELRRSTPSTRRQQAGVVSDTAPAAKIGRAG